MPPKKPAADSADPPQSPSSDTLVEKTAEGTVRKLPAHPSTVIMVREALKELDSRKGVSYQAIQSFIKQKYPTVDMVRLKHLVRKALKKGLETGTLVRPANATVTTGALGKFRLAPKVKESKPKVSENVDPNVKVTKVAKDGVKKPKTAAVGKTKSSGNGETKTSEDSKPPKKSKKDESAPSKPAPAKKPKAKKAEVKAAAEGSSDATKTKVAKTTKGAKAPQSKAAKAGSDASSSKATGKRGKKPE
ncbi:linker histone H1M [Xenentodon cancila]